LPSRIFALDYLGIAHQMFAIRKIYEDLHLELLLI